MYCECCAKRQAPLTTVSSLGVNFISLHSMPQKGCVLSLTTWTLVQHLGRKHKGTTNHVFDITSDAPRSACRWTPTRCVTTTSAGSGPPVAATAVPPAPPPPFPTLTCPAAAAATTNPTSAETAAAAPAPAPRNRTSWDRCRRARTPRRRRCAAARGRLRRLSCWRRSSRW